MYRKFDGPRVRKCIVNYIIFGQVIYQVKYCCNMNETKTWNKLMVVMETHCNKEQLRLYLVLLKLIFSFFELLETKTLF